MLSLCISSRLSTVCFFFLFFSQLPSSFQANGIISSRLASSASECSFTTTPDETKLKNCVKYLESPGAVSSISCTETTKKECQIGLHRVTEAEGEILLKVANWTADGIILIDTKWKNFEFMPTSFKTNKKTEKFRIRLMHNRQLTSVSVPEKDIILQIIDCPRLDLKTMLKIHKIAQNNPKSWVPSKLGMCLEKEPIRDLTKIDEICRYLTGIVNITGQTVDKIPDQRQFHLQNRSCLIVDDTNLKSLSFLEFGNSQMAKCRANITNNPLLCLSSRNRQQLSKMYPINLEIANNDDTCVHQCLSADFVAGKVTDPGKCFSLLGHVILDGDASAKLDFSQIYEIRQGGLTIRNTHVNYWSKFTNLRSIDTGTTGGPALSITGVKLATPMEFSPQNLIKIWMDNVTGPPIIFRDNLKYILALDEYYYLGNLTNKAVDLGSEPIPTAKPIITSTERGKEKEKEENDKDDFDVKDLVTKWWFYAGLIGVLVLVVAAIVIPIVACRRCCRNTAFRLPDVPHPAANKTDLLRNLADEILQRNPLDWSQLVQQETTQLVPANEREKELCGLRQKYEKFLASTFRREPVNFQQATADNKQLAIEIYQYFKGYRQENPNNCKMLLLSTSKDPSKSIPLFSGIVSEPTVFKGTFGGDSSVSLGQYSSADTREKFEIKSTLLERKDYNNDIFTYRYQIQLKEGGQKPTSFAIELIHYHKWSESSEDWRTILQLLEYGRGKKPPVVVTSNPSQSFAVLMLVAVLYHVADKTFPDTMSIAEMRKLVSHRVNCKYPADLWLLYALMVIVAWADEEHLIPEQKKTQFKDFAYILKKMNEFVANNPNNFMIKPENLKLEKTVTKRIKQSRDSMKTPDPVDPNFDDTTSVSEFRKQSTSDPSGPPTK